MAFTVHTLLTFLSFNTTLPGYTNLPNFLLSTKYVNPDDSNHTNWHHLCGTSRFDDLQRNPLDMAIFQSVMRVNAANKMPWTKLYPVKENIVNVPVRIGQALVVDVGGGAGHDLELVRTAWPGVFVAERKEGRLVLQDQESVIAQVTPKPGLLRMAHNFFEEQPVKGEHMVYSVTILIVKALISAFRSTHILFAYSTSRLD